jgi:hypothetical protein
MTNARFRFLALLLASTIGVAAGAQKIAVGIAPVFDGGGEEFGPTVAQHLTLFVYQDLLGSHSAQPSLLSPGGVYSPLDTSWLVEYVQDRPEISLLLVATLKPVINPSKEHWIIPVDLELLNARSGDTVASWSVNTAIDSHKTLMDYGQVIIQQQSETRFGGRLKGVYTGVPSRDFEKQPLGKATAQLASSIRQTLEAKLAGLSPATPAPASQSALVSAVASGAAASCPINVRITYSYKHAASHAYVLLANGLDESTDLKDGVASFSAPSGELLLQFSVNDAPYKLQKENLYQFSSINTCKLSTLIVDLGPGGDARAHWE